VISTQSPAPAPLLGIDSPPDAPLIHGILTGIDASVTLVALLILVVELARVTARRRLSQAHAAATPTLARERDSLRPRSRGELFSLHDAPARPNAFTQEAVLAAVAAYFLVAAILSAVLRPASGEPSVLSALTIDNGARLAGSAVCVWAILWRFHGGLAAFVFGPPNMSRGQAAITTAKFGILVVGLAPLIGVVTAWLMQTFSPAYIPPEHPTLTRIAAESANLAAVLALWIGAGVIAPVAEELFFRGLLQTILVNALPSRRMAVVWAALAFGLVHFNQPHAMPALVFIGVCTGVAYEKTGSLLVPALIHVFFNLRTLIWHALAGGVPP
jgi:hypothetical protein